MTVNPKKNPNIPLWPLLFALLLLPTKGWSWFYAQYAGGADSYQGYQAGADTNTNFGRVGIEYNGYQDNLMRVEGYSSTLNSEGNIWAAFDPGGNHVVLWADAVDLGANYTNGGAGLHISHFFNTSMDSSTPLGAVNLTPQIGGMVNGYSDTTDVLGNPINFNTTEEHLDVSLQFDLNFLESQGVWLKPFFGTSSYSQAVTDLIRPALMPPSLDGGDGYVFIAGYPEQEYGATAQLWNWKSSSGTPGTDFSATSFCPLVGFEQIKFEADEPELMELWLKLWYDMVSNGSNYIDFSFWLGAEAIQPAAGGTQRAYLWAGFSF